MPAPNTLLFRRRQCFAGSGNALAFGIEEREIGVQPHGQFFQRLLLHIARRVGRRQGCRRHFSGHLEGLARGTGFYGQAPHGPGGQHHQQQARYDREIDLQIEAFHRQPDRPAMTASRASSGNRRMFFRTMCVPQASVLRLGEDVARPAHGDDAPGFLRIVFDRLADARHVYVDGTVERFEQLSFDEIHDRLA